MELRTFISQIQTSFTRLYPLCLPRLGLKFCISIYLLLFLLVFLFGSLKKKMSMCYLFDHHIHKVFDCTYPLFKPTRGQWRRTGKKKGNAKYRNVSFSLQLRVCMAINCSFDSVRFSVRFMNLLYFDCELDVTNVICWCLPLSCI